MNWKTIELWWTRLLDFLSPRLCTVCGRRLAATEHSLCTSCLLHLPRTGFEYDPEGNPMAMLFWHHTKIEKAAALFYYEPHALSARLIYKMKYGDRDDVCYDMGRIMATAMADSSLMDGISLLVPVPLSARRSRQRGYNQSLLLAEGVSSITGIAVGKDVLRRSSFLKSQTQLSRHERQKNVENVFSLQNARLAEGKHIMLIDDIATTGATLAACANALAAVPGVSISVLTLGFTKR